MHQVQFYESIDDNLLKFAVIVSRHNGKWIFCKHRQRKTYECPGGHREAKESIDEAAKRELWEETGATQYELHRIAVYSVQNGKEETFGMLYFADVHKLGRLPSMEIEKIFFFDELPSVHTFTYPFIQPLLIRKIVEQGYLL